MKVTRTKMGLLFENEVPIQLKKKIRKLVTGLLKEYSLTGPSKQHVPAFKDTLLSNLFVEIDNEYHSTIKEDSAK